MKKMLVALAMLMCLCLLAACSSETLRFEVKTQPNGGTTTGTTGNNNVLVDGDYMDPLAEEDLFDDTSWMEELPTAPVATPTPAPTIRGEYAGATPVPLDPIDKPTPTPVPPLAAFTYRGYDATKLGLSFEAPAGWDLNTDDPAYFVLTNPAKNVSYKAEIVIHAEKVASQYGETEMKNVVKSMLNAIGANAQVVEFSPSDTASRTLLDAKGVYANYTATLSNGATIRGRVHVTCVERVLYTVHISAPADYWNDYKENVYDHLRDTMRITK